MYSIIKHGAHYWVQITATKQLHSGHYKTKTTAENGLERLERGLIKFMPLEKTQSNRSMLHQS